jgi:transposase
VETTLESVNRTGSRKGRPNYPVEFKKAVVAACLPGRSIAGIAMEHGINANLLFKWRKRYSCGMPEKACIEQPALLPVTIVESVPASSRAEAQAPASLPGPASPAAGTPVARGVIEIRLGRVLVRVDGMVDPATLRTVLQSLRP